MSPWTLWATSLLFEVYLKSYKVLKWFQRQLGFGSELYRLCSIVGELEPTLRRNLLNKSNTHNSNSSSNAPNISMKLIVGPSIVYRIDQSLLYSTHLAEQRRLLEAKECNVIEVANQIARMKRFDRYGPTSSTKNDSSSNETLISSPTFVLHYSLDMIRSSCKVLHEVNDKVLTKYDVNNQNHERKLLELWDTLCEEPLTDRISFQWQQIGFQNSRADTDFRGMGILGLEQLLYFSKKYTKVARYTVDISQEHTKDKWYSWAIVGITITNEVVRLLRTRQLQFQLFKFGETIDTCHEVYCYIFLRFNQFWISKDVTILDFPNVFAEFKSLLEIEISLHRGLCITQDPITSKLMHEVDDKP